MAKTAVTKLQKKVSVIIPSFNSGEFLDEAIQSVAGQTYKNLEIIVVNDGSSDNTEEIVRRWQKQDSRIRYIEHRFNKGLAAARNTGIKNSYGEYIAFLDADDVWIPTKLEVQIHAIEKEKVQGAFSNWWIWDNFSGSKKLAFFENPLRGSKDIINSLVKKNFGNSSTFVTKKEIFNQIGFFDETLKASEDYDFWLRLFFNNIKIAWINEPLVFYRQHNSQMSLNIYRMKMSRLKIFKKIVRNYPIALIRYPVLLQKIILLESYKVTKYLYEKNSSN